MLKTVSSISNALGSLNYRGTWDALNNTPTLVSSVGTKGDYYVVSVAGSTNLNGVTLWGVGDWAVFNGSIWQKVDGGDTTNITSLTVTSLTGYMYANNTSPVTASVTIPNNGLANSNVIIGNTTISLGGTTANLGNITIANVTIISGSATLTYANVVTAIRTQALTGYLYGNANTGNVSASPTIPQAALANSTLTLGNTTLTLGATTTSVGNLTLANANISATTAVSATFATSSLPLVPAGYISILLNGTTVKIPYYAV